jgi:hypothetical protein
MWDRPDLEYMYPSWISDGHNHHKLETRMVYD